MKALVLSTAIATFAAIGAASAQPFDMSRDQADRVTAGSGGFNVHVFKNVQEENLKLIEIKAELESEAQDQGQLRQCRGGRDRQGAQHLHRDQRPERRPGAPLLGLVLRGHLGGHRPRPPQVATARRREPARGMTPRRPVPVS